MKSLLVVVAALLMSPMANAFEIAVPANDLKADHDAITQYLAAQPDVKVDGLRAQKYDESTGEITYFVNLSNDTCAFFTLKNVATTNVTNHHTIVHASVETATMDARCIQAL